MFQNKEKAEVIIAISGAKREESIRNVLRLLEILIEEAHIELESEEEKNVHKMQGAIKAYRGLKETILRGLPAGNLVA